MYFEHTRTETETDTCKLRIHRIPIPKIIIFCVCLCLNLSFSSFTASNKQISCDKWVRNSSKHSYPVHRSHSLSLTTLARLLFNYISSLTYEWIEKSSFILHIQFLRFHWAKRLSWVCVWVRVLLLTEYNTIEEVMLCISASISAQVHLNRESTLRSAIHTSDNKCMRRHVCQFSFNTHTDTRSAEWIVIVI